MGMFVLVSLGVVACIGLPWIYGVLVKISDVSDTEHRRLSVLGTTSDPECSETLGTKLQEILNMCIPCPSC